VNAPTLPGNRRLLLLAGVAVVALLAIVLVVRSCGGDEEAPPQSEVAKLVPDTTLVFADLSTDRDREAVERAADLAHRFGAYRAPTRTSTRRRTSTRGSARRRRSRSSTPASRRRARSWRSR
jgi:hypothetical protein